MIFNIHIAIIEILNAYEIKYYANMIQYKDSFEKCNSFCITKDIINI